jgi:hypothetical protein
VGQNVLAFDEMGEELRAIMKSVGYIGLAFMGLYLVL